MALDARSASKHNQMITRFLKKTESTQLGDVTGPPAKKQKINSSAGKHAGHQAAESDGEDGSALAEEATEPQRTDLESALLPVKSDQEAMEQYEAFKASQEETRGKSSLYVDAFNLALDTVLEEESHLFDEAEMKVFSTWRELDYEAQYLYVRFFLRKTSAWHRIKDIGYHGDISDLDAAVEILQRTHGLPTSDSPSQPYPAEREPPPGTALGPSFSFADRSEEEITTLEQASELLKLDELKSLAKEAKVRGRNKKELVNALRRTSRRQVGLGFVGLKRSETETSQRSSMSGPDTPDSEPADDFSSDANRDAHFTRKILNETGSCIRLSLTPLKLFERVHLVFYRSTEWTEKSLTTIILAKIARRNFPDYLVSRSANIFSSRALLLEFEAAVRTQYRIDNILEFNGRVAESGYQEILDIFEDVYPRWKALVHEEQQKEDSLYHSGEGAYLRRLSPAWVYTRIVHKATGVLARRKHHQREHELVTELVRQRLFHHSRRGAWYQRKALLEEHYLGALTDAEGRNDEAQKRHWRRIALQTCETGLQDNLVHIIHHYDLQKRVIKLEKSLRVVKRAQHDFSHVRLTQPVQVVFQGIRIERQVPSLRRTDSSPIPNTGRRGAKTVWVDPREDGECSVEAMCLSHYRNQGWKGFHSEGGIVRTLFAYLFFDIMFTYIPNVFQTPYQTCPLDLHTDAFYPTRISEINARLNEISNGDAPTIIQRVYDAHHERRTCVIGLDWTYGIADLVQIAECFAGEALATICKVMAQEYGQRGGGVPDLFLWRVADNEETAGQRKEGEVKFAEVKSENDRLSDTQRLWIHVLSGAGVQVELCAVVAKEVRVV